METFGYAPRVAWSLENSGHSSANSRIIAESGIESIFLWQIDPAERERRLAYGEMEFIWRPMYAHLGRKTEILSHVFYDFETSPLDLLIADDHRPHWDPSGNHTIPNKTDPVGPPPEPHQRPDNLTQSTNITSPLEMHMRDYLLEMSTYYKTPHLLMMIGTDANFEKAEYYYQSLERVIKRFN